MEWTTEQMDVSARSANGRRKEEGERYYLKYFKAPGEFQFQEREKKNNQEKKIKRNTTNENNDKCKSRGIPQIPQMKIMTNENWEEYRKSKSRGIPQIQINKNQEEKRRDKINQIKQI